MKKVLVPLDGKKASEEALPFLHQVCAENDTIVLLSVQKPEYPVKTGDLGRRYRNGSLGCYSRSAGVCRDGRRDSARLADDYLSGWRFRCERPVSMSAQRLASGARG
jgi:hypothetical protein